MNRVRKKRIKRGERRQIEQIERERERERRERERGERERESGRER